jgi:hypothetical protein
VTDACCDCEWACVTFTASNRTEIETDVCNLAISTTYYHNNGSGSLPIVGSIVYTSSNCEDSLTGTVNVAQSGFYKISATQYMKIGLDGIVAEINDC